MDDLAGPVTVELWAVPAPLPRPVVTPAGTFDTYHHLVARAVDDDSRAGWGLAAGVTAVEVERCIERARSLLAAARRASPGSWASRRSRTPAR